MIDLNALADVLLLCGFMTGLGGVPFILFDRACESEKRDRQAAVRAYVANHHYSASRPLPKE